MNVSVYNYENPSEFLLAVLAHKKQRNPSFSLRAWARQLKLSQPILLSRILKGQRPLNSELSAQVAASLSFNEDERRYFDLLVLHQSCKSLEQKEMTASLLRSLNPSKQFTSLEVDEFRFVADWYHLAILELAETKTFRDDAQWIASRLGNSLSKDLVERAIDRLLRMGLLTRDSKSKKLQRKDIGALKIKGGKASEAIRHYHRQMIEKAMQAVDSQTVDQRYLAATTLPVTAAALEEIKQIINKCQNELAACASRGNADHVYQINFQLFQLA